MRHFFCEGRDGQVVPKNLSSTFTSIESPEQVRVSPPSPAGREVLSPSPCGEKDGNFILIGILRDALGDSVVGGVLFLSCVPRDFRERVRGNAARISGVDADAD